MLAGFVFSQQVFWQLGAMLVNDGPPQRADFVMVLGGDRTGNRVLKAAELVRQGFAPRVLVGGAMGYFGHHESDLAIDFAASRGYPRQWFVPFQYGALATSDEESHDIPELKKSGAHKILLVTSPWHTARAVRIFHRIAPDLEVHAVGCDDPFWNNGFWWKTREGRKLWLMEMVKNVAERLGI